MSSVVSKKPEDAILKICLAGASPDTGNLGVSALCTSALHALLRIRPRTEITVFDEGKGCRISGVELGGQKLQYKLCGEKLSRRYWQAEALWNIRVSSWFGGLRNVSARAILDADGVLDVSGGDSFTDLYGEKRFAAVTMLKRIVLERGIPLVLLPQTYGPFFDLGHRCDAQRIIAGSVMAWARDQRSYETLKQLLGSDFDPSRHHCGVDMAFALEPLPPAAPMQQLSDKWIAQARPVIGLNVSGLIFNSDAWANRRYDLKADYRQLVIQFARRLLEQTDCTLVLVPHVIAATGHPESDVDACCAVASALDPRHSDRVFVLPVLSDPREIKWVLARMTWFCGTRMHATIAAMSSGVPTAAIAYSLKTAGVFESCGQGKNVVDPRELDTADAVEALWQCWQRRDATATALYEKLPGVINQAVEQMRMILQEVSQRSRSRMKIGAE